MTSQAIQVVLTEVNGYKEENKKRFNVVQRTNHVYIVSPGEVRKMIVEPDGKGGYNVSTRYKDYETKNTNKSLATVKRILHDLFS